MVFLNPVFKDQELIRYYEHNNTAQASAHQSETEFYTRIYSSGLNSIQQFSRSGSLLDIGCSSGLFLDLAKDIGYKTYGIELNKLELDIASSKGHTVLGLPVQDAQFDTSFDVITLWDVFEHIKNGIDHLKYLSSILSDNGLVFLQNS